MLMLATILHSHLQLNLPLLLYGSEPTPAPTNAIIEPVITACTPDDMAFSIISLPEELG